MQGLQLVFINIIGLSFVWACSSSEVCDSKEVPVFWNAFLTTSPATEVIWAKTLQSKVSKNEKREKATMTDCMNEFETNMSAVLKSSRDGSGSPCCCQTEWIYFNAGTYNIFFLLVKVVSLSKKKWKGQRVWVIMDHLWGGGQRETSYSFKEQKLREHLTHMVRIKGCATCH